MTQNSKEDFKRELYKPRPIFLVFSLMFIILAILVYAYDDVILGESGGDVTMTYVLSLLVCVLLSGAMLMCYRNPKLGNKILGYDALDDAKVEQKGPSVFSTGFKFESGADEKRMGTQRKNSRATRRKYAKMTREMQKKTVESKEL
ncbi:hypothetical protein QGN29_08390 [Temperatibacter marinus]|uniref:Uncharacterized protein n=1 Tax=Temperatibacter marinus TaxID=1456591 RepID=A0AA52EA87_9PROT|nr:hypothetical protein [Temperatibacter marinus]WND01577.1 hypothetical protein QGN29_08390 [Temperatibacter marinus]